MTRPIAILRPVVLGGVDGVITSFAIVAGAFAGGLARRTVVVVGTSSVFADGLSMGVSEYLSSYATRRAAASDDAQSESPLLLGFACFVAFVFGGAIPLVTYLFTEKILTCAIFGLLCLMILGAARTWVSHEPILVGLLQTSLLGAAAGAVAYLVGGGV